MFTYDQASATDDKSGGHFCDNLCVLFGDERSDVVKFFCMLD